MLAWSKYFSRLSCSAEKFPGYPIWALAFWNVMLCHVTSCYVLCYFILPSFALSCHGIFSQFTMWSNCAMSQTHAFLIILNSCPLNFIVCHLFDIFYRWFTRSLLKFLSEVTLIFIPAVSFSSFFFLHYYLDVRFFLTYQKLATLGLWKSETTEKPTQLS